MSFGRNIILSCISRELYWPFHQRTWEFWKNSGDWWPLCHLCLYEWDCNPNQLRVTCSDGWLQPHLFLAGPPLGFTIRGCKTIFWGWDLLGTLVGGTRLDQFKGCVPAHFAPNLVQNVTHSVTLESNKKAQNSIVMEFFVLKMTSKCASRHYGAHFLDIATS